MKSLKSKSIKLNKTKRTICVTAASRKLGVTHICLSIANLLASALKQQVLYVEVAERSQLLSVVGEHQIDFHGHTAFKYKGVTYMLAASVKEAMEVMNLEDTFIIYDLEGYNVKTDLIFGRCHLKLVIGSMKPWCSADFFKILNLMKGKHDINGIRFLNIGSLRDEQRKFHQLFNTHLESLPIINNPFLLKEEDFKQIIKLIE